MANMANKGEEEIPNPTIPNPNNPTLRAEFWVLNTSAPFQYSWMKVGVILQVPNIPTKLATRPPIKQPPGLTKGNPAPMATQEEAKAVITPAADALYLLI